MFTNWSKGDDQMATIKDIAEEVGISKAAVSRILNHKGSFSSETIGKVERAAKRLNYKTMNMLKQENGMDGKTLALVFPNLISPNYGVLSTLIEKAAYDYGYDVMLYSSMYEKRSEEEFFQEIKKRNISGIIFCTFVKDSAILAKQDIPAVTLGFKSGESTPAVSSDDYSCGCIAAKHLASRGCRKLLYVTRYPEGLKYDMRYKGFLDEAKRYGVQVWPYQVDIDMDLQLDAPGIITEMSVEHPDADGVFLETFRLASIFYRTYTDLGYRIPQDIKIVGYGNSYMSMYSNPRLTIVKENTRQIAERAVSLLIDLIETDEPMENEKINDIFVPVSLELGQTS